MSTTTIALKSRDNQYFTIEKKIAIKSTTIKNMLDEDCSLSVIPLPNLDAKTLALVIELLNKETEDVKAFVENQHRYSTLFDIIKAAKYLDLNEMMDFGCQKVADMLKGKTAEEIRRIFGIVNDYTPEEKAEVRREDAWAFE